MQYIQHVLRTGQRTLLTHLVGVGVYADLYRVGGFSQKAVLLVMTEKK